VAVLVGYNAIHSPESLITSLIVIVTVFFFSFFYNLFRRRAAILSPYMDKNLAKDEEKKRFAKKISKEA